MKNFWNLLRGSLAIHKLAKLYQVLEVFGKFGGKPKELANGGVRIIYFAGIENIIHLMTIYGKNVKENMKASDLRKLKEALLP